MMYVRHDRSAGKADVFLRFPIVALPWVCRWIYSTLISAPIRRQRRKIWVHVRLRARERMIVKDIRTKVLDLSWFLIALAREGLMTEVRTECEAKPE